MAIPGPVTALTLLQRAKEKGPGLFLLQDRSMNESGSLGCAIEKASCFELKLGITEIAGSAGCGKTQIALGLCVACANTPCYRKPLSFVMMNYNSCPVTEGPLLAIGCRAESLKSAHCKPHSHDICQSQRVEKTPLTEFGKALFLSLGEGTPQSIIARRLSQLAGSQDPNATRLKQKADTNVLHRILIQYLRNEDEFTEFIFQDLPRLLQDDETISLFVVDSIAAMFRHCDTRADAPKRSALLFQVSAHLKCLSESHKVPIVVVNQATADCSKSENEARPALGLAWSHCVTERFFVSRSESESGFESTSCISAASKHPSSSPTKLKANSRVSLRFRRICRSLFSPHRQSAGLSHFLVDDDGPFLISPPT